MDIDEIAKACELGSSGYVKEQLTQLIMEYRQKNGALHIVEQDGRFKLNIKKEFGHLANNLVSTNEFDSPTTKTLALIAYKNPAIQSDIIKARGNKAYDHIKILAEQCLVTSEKSGRTRLLKLAPKFYDYFDTADQTAKDVFKNVEDSVKQQVAAKAGMTVEEVVEKKRLLEEAQQREKELREQVHEESKKDEHAEHSASEDKV